MEGTLQDAFGEIAIQFLTRNYDYLWLRTMLEQAAATETDGSTLITGSSHALNAIREGFWNNAFNCSMHSQDLYYDFLCARRVLNAAAPGRFSRCFIVMGYYSAWQDLSLSKKQREIWIPNVYDPIFNDTHHWETPVHKDLWDWLNFSLPDGGPLTPEMIRSTCEDAATRILLRYGTYYSELRLHGTRYDLKGHPWAQIPLGNRLALARTRAEDHNKNYWYKSSFEENKQILRDFVRFLYEHEVRPIVVVMPFAPEYNQFILPELYAGTVDLLESVPEDIEFVDFNQIEGIFELTDFMDTDHLNEAGAEKVSSILADTFGKSWNGKAFCSKTGGTVMQPQQL